MIRAIALTATVTLASPSLASLDYLRAAVDLTVAQRNCGPVTDDVQLTSIVISAALQRGITIDDAIALIDTHVAQREATTRTHEMVRFCQAIFKVTGEPT